jgi:hypothetical protein
VLQLLPRFLLSVLDNVKRQCHRWERNTASLLAARFNRFSFESRSAVDQLALCIAYEIGSLVNALARFALQISDQSPQFVAIILH